MIFMCGEASAKVFDRVVAKVNSDIITMSAVEERVGPYREMLMRSGQETPPTDELMKQILDIMIEERLQIQRGKKLGIQVEEESVLSALDEIKEKNHLSDQEMEIMLQREGRSLEQYKEQIRNQILVSRVARFQFGNRIIVTDQLAKQYYEKMKQDFMNPERIKVRHILFILDAGITDAEREVKRKRAEMTLQEIRSGKSFEEMARRYSEDVSASSGGEIGLLAKGKLVPEFEEVAFSLRDGEVSDVVKTRFGYHIIKVDQYLASQPKPYDDDLKEKIKDIIFRKASEKKYKDWVQTLKSESFIEVKLDEESAVEEPKRLKKRSRTKAASPKAAPAEAKLEREWDEEIEVSSKKIRKSDATSSKNLQSMENKLRRMKQLRDAKKISEAEYQKKKMELLDQL